MTTKKSIRERMASSLVVAALIAMASSLAVPVAATAAVADTSAALCRPEIDCPLPKPYHCRNHSAPTYVDYLSDHVIDRMRERDVSQFELDVAIRNGARNAFCQRDTGRWKYGLGMPGGWLVVIVAVDNDGTATAITAWWE
ncbi:DUF4258 domain-containing protein [Streptosporangium sp. NPDC051022]|uniref:DUF4258 domain-containing protein n=1 Tax=Streptosporangium sp. NPDC051022 TaxID=3155752 RepID=UPI0034316363